MRSMSFRCCSSAFSRSVTFFVTASRATPITTRNKTIRAVMRSAKEIQNGFSASSRPPRLMTSLAPTMAYTLVEQRHVDHLALAAGVAVAQRREDGHRRVHAGEQVRHRDADLLRPAAGQIV